jgi:hypothetical protein
MDSKYNKKKNEKDLTKKKPVDKTDAMEEETETCEVPTVEGRRFKNVKTFQEMLEEGFSSPLTQFKTKAKDEIKSKVNSITSGETNTAEPKEKVAAEPKKGFMKNLKDMVTPSEKQEKTTRGNISALKTEISNKMKELDTMFTNNTENVAQQAQEVKQLMEKLNHLLGKLK